jgi:signal peptidase II
VRRKLAYFFALFVPIIVVDLATKSWALEALATRRGELLGGLVPLTLAFNKGAAFGISIGDDSRWFFVPVTLLALVLLGVLLRQAERDDHLRIVAVSLVVSGALGNLWDRVRWDRGVVDFLGPIDLGFWDFPIFNVADMAITCGAILLALSFWMEERALVAAEEEAGRVEAARSMDEAADDAGSRALTERAQAEPRPVEPVSRDRRSEA